MNEFKGTPGPWGFSEWDDGRLPFGIETDKGITLAYVCEDYPRTEYTTRLIAAAPDLLEALYGFCVWLRELGLWAMLSDFEKQRVKDAEAIIAKALGE